MAPAARSGMLRVVAYARYVAALLIVTYHGACTPDTGPDGPGRAARGFYAALAKGNFDEAHAMTLESDAARGLERRFGSLAAWGNRLTKNGIVMRTEALDESVDGARARVELLVLFDDGTRRHDLIGLARRDGRWLVDMSSVPGAEPDAHARGADADRR